MGEPDEAAAKMVQAAMSIYQSRPERAAMRCALGDAAGLCDALARAIEADNKGNHGKGAITKQGQDRAAIARRCGDAIWQMRELVWFEDAQ